MQEERWGNQHLHYNLYCDVLVCHYVHFIIAISKLRNFVQIISLQFLVLVLHMYIQQTYTFSS